jgi:hypothetical protein
VWSSLPPVVTGHTDRRPGLLHPHFELVCPGGTFAPQRPWCLTTDWSHLSAPPKIAASRAWAFGPQKDSTFSAENGGINGLGHNDKSPWPKMVRGSCRVAAVLRPGARSRSLGPQPFNSRATGMFTPIDGSNLREGPPPSARPRGKLLPPNHPDFDNTPMEDTILI